MLNLEPEQEIRTFGGDSVRGLGGNSRVLHVLAELRAAGPERRDVLAADHKARGLRADVIDELARIAAASDSTVDVIRRAHSPHELLHYL